MLPHATIPHRSSSPRGGHRPAQKKSRGKTKKAHSAPKHAAPPPPPPQTALGLGPLSLQEIAEEEDDEEDDEERSGTDEDETESENEFMRQSRQEAATRAQERIHSQKFDSRDGTAAARLQQRLSARKS